VPKNHIFIENAIRKEGEPSGQMETDALEVFVLAET